MGRSAVRVVVRLRPTDKFCDRVAAQDDGKTVLVSMPRLTTSTASHNTSTASAPSSPISESHPFRTDMVLKDASQETVFETCAQDVVRGAVAGYNGCVMAYGQTGAGKTYTVVGGTDYRTRGIIPRAIKSVFEEVISHAERQYTIQVSYIEIYNDRISDLLDPSSKEDFAILEDAKGAITVRGATMRTCSQEQEALSCLFLGNQNRTSIEHAMNQNSSRSHAIFTIHISSRSRVESDSATLLGKAYLVDLAGSERLSVFSEVTAQTLKEAQHINKSLTFLEQVVMALGSAHRSHVPFRQSKLTNILKDSLGGNSRTTMIANVWPEERNMEETLSTLKFATRMMRVQNEASVNVLVDPQTQVKQLQRQVSELKAELNMQNQLMGKTHVQYEGEVSEDERFEMEKVARNYLAGKVPEIPVRSLREVKEYFRVFKAFADQREAEMKSAQTQLSALQQAQEDAAAAATGGKNSGKGASSMDKSNRAGGAPTSKAAAAALAEEQQKLAAQLPVAVGALDPGAGQGLGVAAPSKNLREMAMQTRNAKGGGGGNMSSPNNANNNAANSPDRRERTPTEYYGDGASPGVGRGGGDNNTMIPLPPVTPPNRNEAFAQFKSAEGAAVCEQIQQRVEALKALAGQVTKLAEQVNSHKRNIDAAQAKLQKKQAARQQQRAANNRGGGRDDVIDDEEFDVVQDVKRFQKDYRDAYDKHHEAKRLRDNETRLLDRSKKQLLDGFDKWYSNTFRGGGGGGGGFLPSAGTMGGTFGGGGGAATSPSRFPVSYSRGASQSNSPNRFNINSAGGAGGGSGGGGGGHGDTFYSTATGDELDEGEKFDMLELQRVMGEDPESVAFFQAKKLAGGGVGGKGRGHRHK